MNEDNVTEILLVLKSYYLNAFNNIKNDFEMEIMIKSWTRKLERYAFEEVMTAVERIASKNKFMPSISEIIEEIETIKNPIMNTSAEEESVSESVRKYGFYQYKKADEMFSPLTAKIVKQIGYYNLCSATNDLANRKRFIELYNKTKSEIRELNLIGNKHLTEKEINNKKLLENFTRPLLEKSIKKNEDEKK